MKLTTGILAVVMITGAAWGQNPGAIDNTRSAVKSVPQTTTNNSAVLVAQATKPAPGAPAPAVKPATIPGAAAAPAPAKAVVMPASSQNNTLQRVKVVQNADAIQIEISSREAVIPKVSKLSSPARVLVELPATVMATPQSKIAVGNGGVKGVRIGMDGKIPPTTSVVVDLEQALGYELTPGPGNSFVLTLHTQAVAKSAPAAAPAKAPAAAAKVQAVAAKPVVAVQAAKAAKGTPAPSGVSAASTSAAKPHDAFMPKKPGASTAVATAKVEAPKPAATASGANKIAANEKPSTVAEALKTPKPEEKKWAMNGKRDPFFSPVVQQATGSGCSTGKKCLEIGQINLRGVVHSESGFIAVVTNTLNKAYFLHENDPVFNGYVMRITGDSVVFEETVQDKLGKPFTREVVKRIITPAV
jgi:Tfp pilus assembly protein PilP